MAKSSTASTIEPGQRLTFTVRSVPARPAERKTIRRLMRMQTHVQKGLSKLALRRKRHDNTTYQRAGRPWTNRVKPAALTNVAAGESFTLTVTPQIIPDIRSVEKHLDVKKGA